MTSNSFGTALRNIFKNSLMSFASIVSVAFTLIMLGFVLLLLLNMQHATSQMEERFDTIRYAVPLDYTEDQVASLGETILKIPNVISADLITKEEALAEMEKRFGKGAFAGLPENPLPYNYNIVIEDISKAQDTISALQALDPKGKIGYTMEVAVVLSNLAQAIRVIGVSIILALLFITILSIVNSIRVGISNHQSEITIMRYVGATRGYIRGPFLLEGLILGILGASVSSLVLYYSYGQLLSLMINYVADLSNQLLLTDIKVVYQVILLNFVIGAGVGFLGSLFSMRKYLEA